jgi:glyoxalase family protein
MSFITGYHHLTLSTHGAQEDYDFYTKTLGLHSIKRTVLFDGVIPVYHLYYGAKNGDPSTIVTTFPFKKPGIYGKRGTNQSKIIQLSIPVGAADFWVNRLNGRGIRATRITRFGITRVALAHPCGIEHELVESPVDMRPPITSEVNGVGADHGIRGIYGAAVAVFDRTSMDDFLVVGMGMKKEADNDEGLMFSVPNNDGPSSMVEVLPIVSHGVV